MSQSSEFADSDLPQASSDVSAHLIPSNALACSAIVRTAKGASEFHITFIKQIDYRQQPSVCFELALNNLPEHPGIGWCISKGHEDKDSLGFDLLLVAMNDSLAGVHVRFVWTPGVTGFFLMIHNQRRKYCTINGDDFSIYGQKWLIPLKNTILLGDCAFTLQYVQRDPAAEENFQFDPKEFLTAFHNENPVVLPTLQEADSRFGDWVLDGAIQHGTSEAVYQVHHSLDEKQAAAKQLFVTKRNRSKIIQEVRMAKVSKLKGVQHQWIAVPFDIRHVGNNRPQVEVDRIKKPMDNNRNSEKQGNVIDECIVFRPLRHATLCAVIGRNQPTLSRTTFFAKILSTVSFLYDHVLCHRDIKPENILVQSYDPPSPLLSDFVFTRSKPVNEYDFPGTVAYLAPEQVNGQSHSTNVDSRSYGVVGYELLTKEQTRQRVWPGPKLDAYHATLSTLGDGMPYFCKPLLYADPDQLISAGGALFLVRAGFSAEEEGKVWIGDERVAA